MVVPVEQICPICGSHFKGSDVFGMPCIACQGFGIMDDKTLTDVLGESIYGPFKHEEKDPEDDDGQ